MQPTIRRKCSGINKRHTWPRTEIEQLETIPESPRLPSEVHKRGQNANLKTETPVTVTEQSADLLHAQMLWYSHHLAESHQDRERQSRKTRQLEDICKSQSKTNAALLNDVKSWQNSYDEVEAELVEAAQEIEEAKAYVRSIETSNANLRYALSQAKEEAECARQKSLRNRFRRIMARLRFGFRIQNASADTHLTTCGPAQTIYTKETKSDPATPVSKPKIPQYDRSGATSRLRRHGSSSPTEASPTPKKG